LTGFVISTHEKLTPEREADLKKRGEKLLTGLIGTTEDIAEAYLYFARAKFTTGTRTCFNSLYDAILGLMLYIYLVVSVVDGGLLLV
jgi:hypothetical protein